jgi:hypothetical protein
MVSNLPIVSEIVKSVVFDEVQLWSAKVDVVQIWGILRKICPILELEPSVGIGKKRIRRLLKSQVGSGLKLMFAVHIAPVVLDLISIHYSALRKAV